MIPLGILFHINLSLLSIALTKQISLTFALLQLVVHQFLLELQWVNAVIQCTSLFCRQAIEVFVVNWVNFVMILKLGPQIMFAGHFPVWVFLPTYKCLGIDIPNQYTWNRFLTRHECLTRRMIYSTTQYFEDMYHEHNPKMGEQSNSSQCMCGANSVMWTSMEAVFQPVYEIQKKCLFYLLRAKSTSQHSRTLLENRRWPMPFYDL